MEKLEESWEAIQILSKFHRKFKSTRLKQLTTMGNTVKISEEDVYEEDEDDQSCFEGLLPDVIANLEDFKSYIKWEDNVPIPQRGLVAHFDELKDGEDKVKEEL